jgi:hypothetical protein
MKQTQSFGSEIRFMYESKASKSFLLKEYGVKKYSIGVIYWCNIFAPQQKAKDRME